MSGAGERSMAYTCDRCGACCCTFPVLASTDDAVREPRIAACARKLEPWLERPGWRWQLHPLPFQEGCTFLGDDSLCRIYETRPDVCRRFEAGSPECAEARRRRGLPPLGPVDTPPCSF